MKARCADEHGYVLVRNRLMAELLLNGGANRAETIINITRGVYFSSVRIFSNTLLCSNGSMEKTNELRPLRAKPKSSKSYTSSE